jgi:three-Cys-motif partner protein
MKNRETKLSQLEHSQVKVELYAKYLAIYLNVLCRVPSIKHIQIFDLLCGEGKYPNGCLGSSVAAAETIKRHLISNDSTDSQISLLLNDTGASEIEPGKSKIQRNCELIDSLCLPQSVTVIYEELDYSEIIQNVIRKLDTIPSSQRALVFIDPYGYKEINPADLAALLRNHKTELLLFLPASFIYRFSESVMEKDFPGSDAVKFFITGVFGPKSPCFSSCADFIAKFRKALQLKVQTKFSSSFTIERDARNTYCLLFFTNHERGFEKMLEAKWALDENRGHGYRLDNDQLDLFSAGIVEDFEGQVFTFISAAQSRSNLDLKLFGLECEYLPKHTLEVLKSLKKNDKIEAIDDATGKPARSFYLTDRDHRVTIRRKG